MNIVSIQQSRSIASKFIFWTRTRALFYRGWWLVTSLYLVTVGHLTPSQLVMIGVFQGIVSLIFEVPAGVVADTVSRKKALLISHLLMGSAMLATGLVKTFPLLVLTQMIWGIAWSFASGADIAFITDELNEPKKVSRVLTRAARADLEGSALSIILIGLLAAVTSLQTAMIVAGAGMLVLGFYVLTQFKETRFTPTRENRWTTSLDIFKDGFKLVSKSKIILTMFLATVLVNGSSELGRLYPQRLTEVGFPTLSQPIVWLTALNIITLLAGVAALKIVEPRVHGLVTARRDYIFACLVGAVGLMFIGLIPSFAPVFIGIILMDGVSGKLTRTLASIQVNNATTDNVRATVHSFLAQCEYLGEIVLGLGIAVLARRSGSTAFVGGAIIMLITALLIMRLRSTRRVDSIA